jgi:hypothetical protein
MHGLIFMTWEKYLAERLGSDFLRAYREKIGESPSEAPIATRIYDDAILLAGVGAASELSKMPVERLVHEYGQYFITNGLTGHLCSYILSSVHSGRDLLLAMRDAHSRLRRTMEELQPPLFEYGNTNNPNEVILIYDSPRQLCTLLLGAIEGAAMRYGETVEIQELSCMKHGDSSCKIKAIFSAPQGDPNRYNNPERKKRRLEQTGLMKQVWSILPEAGTIDGYTLAQIQSLLIQYKHIQSTQLRPAILVEALHQLQFSGYAMSSAANSNDDFMQRRYWRVHRHM